MRQKDFLIALAGEACLILAIAITGWLTHKPLIFTSLGPTAYELIETPERPSACAYNVFIGHLIGVLAGFVALYVTGASASESVSIHGVPLVRVWAAVAATALTILGTLLAHAAQPLEGGNPGAGTVAFLRALSDAVDARTKKRRRVRRKG